MDSIAFSDRLEEMEEKIDRIRDEFPRFEKLVNPDELVATYEKHIIKIEQMMLEFKGCVSMARSSIAERKELDAELKEMKNVAHIAKDIYNSMHTFIKSADNFEQRNYFKLDAIYREICEKTAKKPKKKVKPSKKRQLLLPLNLNRSNRTIQYLHKKISIKYNFIKRLALTDHTSLLKHSLRPKWLNYGHYP